jgi:hypothetical protein
MEKVRCKVSSDRTTNVQESKKKVKLEESG